MLIIIIIFFPVGEHVDPLFTSNDKLGEAVRVLHNLNRVCHGLEASKYERYELQTISSVFVCLSLTLFCSPMPKGSLFKLLVPFLNNKRIQ